MSWKAGLIFAPCDINIPATLGGNAESDKYKEAFYLGVRLNIHVL